MKRLIISILVILLSIISIGCSKDEETFKYESSFDNWSMDILDEFNKENEENIDNFYRVVYKTYEGIMLTVNEIEDEKMIIDEQTILNELEEDHSLHLEASENFDIDGVGTIYSAFIDDHSTNGNFLYYKTKIDNNIVSIVIYKNGAYTEKEYEKYNKMIKSIKRK